MPNVNNIIGGSSGIDPADRAEDAWNRIQDKPSSIVLIRNRQPLAAQTMRIEVSNDQREVTGGAGMSSLQQVVLFGIKGHCSLPDTDIQRDDRFVSQGIQYKVISVNLEQIGELQARCEAQS